MKTATLIVSSFIVTGLFLGVVLGEEETQCGSNMFAQNCFPCNQVCNGPASSCVADCGTENNRCKCNEGYYLPAQDSTYCVELNECPKPQ